MSSAVHTFEPGPDGRCKGHWYTDSGRKINCNSSQRSSVLHDDPASDFRQRHYHDGGDCMCFEDEPGGYHGAMREYVRSRA